jgi:alkanesulfonate monooxygenase SsuD/methylene tetrahydromethanopterin reductase-like flavin-dependent oxidoreductase (luciferase family)
MRVDGNIGGAIDGTGGGDLAGIAEQVAAAERAGYDGVWTTEVSRDPFLPLLLAVVGPQMTRVAAEAADGMLVHGFTTERYLRLHAMAPMPAAQLRCSRRVPRDRLPRGGLVPGGHAGQAGWRAAMVRGEELA